MIATSGACCWIAAMIAASRRPPPCRMFHERIFTTNGAREIRRTRRTHAQILPRTGLSHDDRPSSDRNDRPEHPNAAVEMDHQSSGGEEVARATIVVVVIRIHRHHRE